jgi:hypothetical protein
MKDEKDEARLDQFISLNTTADRWEKRRRMEDIRRT